METRKAEGIDMFAGSVAVSLALLAGVTYSDGATFTAIMLAVFAIAAAAPLTVRWRSRPTPLEAIRRTVNRPD
jgi:hypothetical protein